MVQRFIYSLLAFTLLPLFPAAADTFEDLGMPVSLRSTKIHFVTGKGENARAWGTVSGEDVRRLVGFNVATGETTEIDLISYKASNIRIAHGENGHIYIFTGNPGRFLKYDPRTDELVDLGIPNSDARYWLGSEHAISREDVFYIGTFPEARLVGVDMRTDKVLDLGRLSADSRQKYIINPAVSNDNIVYAPVGLHHYELWAVNPKTGDKKQILPKELQLEEGTPSIWTGTDGQVYGRVGSTRFLCTPNGIVKGKTASAREYPERRTVANERVLKVDDQGRLLLESLRNQAQRQVQTDFKGVGKEIFSLGGVVDGWLFGSSIKPGHTFAVNLETGETRDFGIVTRGRIQAYDYLEHPRGLFAATYTGGYIDLFDPQKLLAGEPDSRRSVARLASHSQERPMQLIHGPDDALYTVTMPVKGHLGGTLVRIDPEDLSTQVWRNLIPNQSLVSAVSAKTGELFVVSDVSGGTGAQPSEKRGKVFLWDVEKQEVVFEGQPVPAARRYGTVVAAPNGLIYGIAQRYYYAFDPEKRETVHVEALPTGGIRFPGFHSEPVGSEGKIYGISGGAIIAIDPADHSASVVAEDESLRRGRALYITDDKILYYGSGASLMRYQLP